MEGILSFQWITHWDLKKPPDFVSVQKFKDINLGTVLNKIIKGRKTKKYFEEGVSDSQENKEFESLQKISVQETTWKVDKKGDILAKQPNRQSDNKNQVAYEYDEAFHMIDKLHYCI